MFSRRLLLSLVSLLTSLITGCAVPVAEKELSANHPANPAAMESPPPQPLRTLSIDDATLPPPPDGGAVAADMQPEMKGMQHAAGAMKHGEGGEMKGMPHNMHEMAGMKHDTPGTRPGTNADLSAPRWTPTSFPTTAGVFYTCQMHKEVVSSQPGNCPKCGMKLVPKTGTTQPTALTPDRHDGQSHKHEEAK